MSRCSWVSPAVGSGKSVKNGVKKGKIGSPRSLSPNPAGLLCNGDSPPKCAHKHKEIAQEASVSKEDLALVWKQGRLRAPMDVPPESSNWLLMTNRQLGHSKKVQGPLKFYIFAKG